MNATYKYLRPGQYRFNCKCHDKQFHFDPQDDMIRKAQQVLIIQRIQVENIDKSKLFTKSYSYDITTNGTLLSIYYSQSCKKLLDKFAINRILAVIGRFSKKGCWHTAETLMTYCNIISFNMNSGKCGTK